MTFASNIFALHPVARCRMPELIPDDNDELLVQRREAKDRALYVLHRTEHPYRFVCRQYDFHNRLDAIVLRRNAQ